MRRRAFISLLGGAAAWPLAARGQQPGKLPTIGYLAANSPAANSQGTAAFMQRLRELGRRSQRCNVASQEFALPWLMSFDARQQFFFQRSPEPREPLNFCLGTIDSLDNLAEPLNLRLETIEQLDDLAVLVTKRVEAWVCRHQSAHGLFILGEPCQQ